MTTVYVTSSYRRNSKNMAYHTNEDCPRLRDTVREMDLEQAKKKTLTECKYCAGEVEHTEDRRRSLRWAIQNGEVEI